LPSSRSPSPGPASLPRHSHYPRMSRSPRSANARFSALISMSRSGQKPKGTNRHGRSRDKMQRRLRQKRHLRNEEKQPTQATRPFNKEKKMKRNITNINVSAASWLALLPALAIFG